MRGALYSRRLGVSIRATRVFSRWIVREQAGARTQEGPGLRPPPPHAPLCAWPFPALGSPAASACTRGAGMPGELPSRPVSTVFSNHLMEPQVAGPCAHTPADPNSPGLPGTSQCAGGLPPLWSHGTMVIAHPPGGSCPSRAQFAGEQRRSQRRE